MSTLAGDVQRVDESGTWRTVLTAGGVPVDDRRRRGAGLSADYVIIDETYTFSPPATFDLNAGRFGGIVADAQTRWLWRPAT